MRRRRPPTPSGPIDALEPPTPEAQGAWADALNRASQPSLVVLAGDGTPEVAVPTVSAPSLAAVPDPEPPAAEDGPPAERSSIPDLGVIDVEKALRLVRIATAIIASAAVLGSRSGSSHGPLTAAAIVLGALAINAFTTWTGRRGWNAFGAIAGQVLDVAGALCLVVILDHALPGSSWIIMLLPIVMGGVRFGAAGTLLAWTLACSGYLVLAVTGVIDVSADKAAAFGLSLQHFAFLLALAVPVAALTQWMQHRWEDQRSLTLAANLRAQRLELIESLARSFVGATEPRLLANLADAGVQLGFETVTITLHANGRSMTVASVGAPLRLPADDVDVRPEPGETLVTAWQGSPMGDQLTSVSLMLDATGSAIAFHGWSTQAIDDDLAQSFGLLGAHASVALRAARMLADLERQAKQDPLTGLLNRRAFDEQVDRRAQLQSEVALLILDVDHFKAINDGYGHPAGDKVLRVIAERLRNASVLHPDVADAAVARIGGDEFAVLVTGAPLEVVADIADRIEASMREPVAIEGAAVPVSFSIGIADATGAWAPRDLISAADEAAYQAKTHGRNRSCWAPGPVDEHGATVGDDSPARQRPGSAPAPVDDEVVTDPLISLFQRSMDASAPRQPNQPDSRPRP